MTDTPQDPAGGIVLLVISAAINRWRIHNDPADPASVTMPESVRDALADAGLLALPVSGVSPDTGAEAARDAADRAVADSIVPAPEPR